MERTYAGIPEENATLENAKVMLVTVPYDGTSTWGKGADKGPELFLDASENMELYDIETDTEPYLNGVYLAGEVSENSSPEAMTEAVYQKTKELLKNEDKLFTLFGGFPKKFFEPHTGIRRKEVERLNMTPHPVEFEMYYA